MEEAGEELGEAPGRVPHARAHLEEPRKGPGPQRRASRHARAVDRARGVQTVRKKGRKRFFESVCDRTQDDERDAAARRGPRPSGRFHVHGGGDGGGRGAARPSAAAARIAPTDSLQGIPLLIRRNQRPRHGHEGRGFGSESDRARDECRVRRRRVAGFVHDARGDEDFAGRKTWRESAADPRTDQRDQRRIAGWRRKKDFFEGRESGGRPSRAVAREDDGHVRVPHSSTRRRTSGGRAAARARSGTGNRLELLRNRRRDHDLAFSPASGPAPSLTPGHSRSRGTRRRRARGRPRRASGASPARAPPCPRRRT